jgi:predicted Zn-dependent protease
MAALSIDPFAEVPFNELVRIYQTGPGLSALAADLRAQTVAQPANLPFAVLLGRIEIRRGRPGDGLRALRHALELHPSGSLARSLAVVLDENGDREAALRAFNLGLMGASSTEERGILLRLGALYLASGKVKDARAAWELAKQLAPTDQVLRRRIAEALAAHGAFKDAISELKEIEPLLTQQSSAHVDLIRREADYARRAGDDGQVRSLLLSAYGIAVQTGSPALEDELSRAVRAEYARVSRQDELIKLASAYKDPPLDALVGDILAEHKQRDRAVASYKRALQTSPRDRYVLRRLSELEQGDARLRALHALAQADPNDVKLAEEVLVALLDAKQEDEAIVETHRLRDRFVDNSAVLFSLAEILTKHHRETEAIDLYARVLKLEGNRPEYLIAHGNCLRALGRKDEAVRSYWQILGNAPTTATYQRLIKLLKEHNEPVEVKKAYRAALEKAPKDLLLRREFALWLTSGGMTDDAKTEWTRLRDQATDSFIKSQADHAIDQLERQLLFQRSTRPGAQGTR